MSVVADSMHMGGQDAQLLLVDLSCLPKLGIKGEQAEAVLQQAGIPVPAELYAWKVLDGGGLVLRTDRNEFMLEEGPGTVHLEKARSALGTVEEGAYRIERQETGLLLSGHDARQVLAQISGYDFTLEQKMIVRTRAAGVTVIILQLSELPFPKYRIWCAVSFGDYFWSAMGEIVKSLGGKANH